MTNSDFQSKLYRRRLEGCCKKFDPRVCKCPQCGGGLQRFLKDNSWTKLQCTSCTFEHVCGDVGKESDHPPPKTRWRLIEWLITCQPLPWRPLGAALMS